MPWKLLLTCSRKTGQLSSRSFFNCKINGNWEKGPHDPSLTLKINQNVKNCPTCYHHPTNFSHTKMSFSCVRWAWWIIHAQIMFKSDFSSEAAMFFKLNLRFISGRMISDGEFAFFFRRDNRMVRENELHNQMNIQHRNMRPYNHNYRRRKTTEIRSLVRDDVTWSFTVKLMTEIEKFVKVHEYYCNRKVLSEKNYIPTRNMNLNNVA